MPSSRALAFFACVQAATGCAAQDPVVVAAAPAEVTLTPTQPAPRPPPVANEALPSVRAPDPPPPERDAPLPGDAFEGVPGGMATWSGNGVARTPPLAPTSSSTPAKLKGGTSLGCPFPPEADAEKVDNAMVRLVVRVDETGKPLSVKLLSDPGHGFGRAARTCMLSQAFVPGRDEAGVAITTDTMPLTVRFSR